ncbi:MAG: outer membrane beta-barrel protein [Bacteroidales bacterium]|nr:outer membrane beta-barrel protein [Bacteroidales bacterium]
MSIKKDGYATFSESFEIVPGENVILVDLSPSGGDIEPAVASSRPPVMMMKGDTLVYNAAAIDTREGDYAIDILKQFPGVEVQGRSIRIVGQSVRRTYVNGALIFGRDPMSSMENLKGEQVLTMDVYKEKSPEEAIDGDVRPKDLVINIKTKDPIFSVTDIQARAIAGVDMESDDDGKHQKRYTIGANAKFFSEKNILSADLITGNLGMTSSLISVDPTILSNYKEDTSVNLGFDHYWGSALVGDGVQGRYSFTHGWARNRSRTLSEYFEMESFPGRNLESEILGRQKTIMHTFNSTLAYRTAPVLSVNWVNALSFSSLDDVRTLSETTLIPEHDPMLREEHFSQNNRSWSVSENVTVALRKIRKFTPSFGVSVEAGRNNLDSWTLDTLSSSYSRRYLTKDGSGISRSLGFSFRQPVIRYNDSRKLIDMTLTGGYTAKRSSKIQEAYDLLDPERPILNPANTFDYTFNDDRYYLRANMVYGRTGSYSVTASVQISSDRVGDLENLDGSRTERTFYSVLPAVSFTTGKGFTLSYSCTDIIPAVEQIRDYVDDNDPLMLRSGNPGIKKSLSHSFSLSGYSLNFREGKPQYRIDISANIVTDPIVSKLIFFNEDTVLTDYRNYSAPAGSTLNIPENSSPKYSFSASGSINHRIYLAGDKFPVNLSLIPSLSYQSLPQYYGSVFDRTGEFRAGGRLSAGGSFSSALRYELLSSVEYFSVRTASGNNDISSLNSSFGGNVNLEFMQNAHIKGSYRFALYDYLRSSRQDINRHHLDLSIGWSFLKKALSVDILGVDLLNNGKVYSVSSGASSYVRTWTPSYGRSILLSISYRFNSSGDKKAPVIAL